MKDPLTRLIEKSSALGNYNRKYIHIISSNVDKLNSSLEQNGLRDRVHLWNYSREIPGEMDTVLQTASSLEEKLDFVGCYFALQFLNMNIHTIDIVKLEFGNAPRQWNIGRRLMFEAGRMFRYLTKSYMERLLEIFLDGGKTPNFVMLGVGTRADQDDIDLGIIHRETGESEILNKAIARLSTEMLKKASRLHFHLSEHVGQYSFAATIEDYEEILEKGMYDFVIVNEMLGAAVILGDDSLFEDFKARVTDRFYYQQVKGDNRYHEAYLRGILGEVNSLLTRPKSDEVICPKDDGLRPIKSLLSALKLVNGIRRENAWNIIDDLKSKNPERERQYTDLEQTLSFLELFRHLYQIMVVQDEEISLDQSGIGLMIAGIAEMVGFEKKGVVSAKDFLLVNYFEFLDKSTAAIEILSGDLRKHLHNISVFRPIFALDSKLKVGYDGNLALDFIKQTRFFKGIIYWDDFLEELGAEEDLFYNEFVNSFLELPDKMRSVVSQAYISGTVNDINPSLKFLNVMGKKATTDKGKEVFELLSSKFIDVLEKLPGPSDALARAVHVHPDLLNNFMAKLDWESVNRLSQLSTKQPSLPELVQYHAQLQTLCEIHCNSSQFFKRHFLPILEKYPTYIKNLHRNDKLKEITNSFYSDLSTPATIGERIDLLGDYYDLEFVRVSLMAMSGAPCELTDLEFTEFCDNYTLLLYDLCQKEIHLSLGYSTHTRDLFAIYTTGGHAREQGFDDDYDMIVILDSDDREQIEYCTKIVGRMNSEILKRGILPHHRFTDHFNSYILSLGQLEDLLGKNREDTFIDQAQILASRMLVGTGKLEIKLYREIIEPLVFSKGDKFISELKNEMKSRHETMDNEHCYDIKECRGGLRDIEMLLLIYEVKYRIREPLSRKFLRKLGELESDHKQEFKAIEEHLNFMKNLRDLYRLKVAAHNVIDPKYLASVAESMGYGNEDDAGERLFKDFKSRSLNGSSIIEKLIESI
ncbi:MAG: hypothetical protein V3W18_12615 [candidate division Zixibacteria bacterium]